MADAEDVVQDAFVRFWRNQRSLGGDPFGLILTSVRRAAIDRARKELRRAHREKIAATEPADPAPVFEPLAEGDERRLAIEEALRRLPPGQREVLVCKIWGERTFEEIGRELGISPHTAASRYRYALSSLSNELKSKVGHA